MQRDCVTIESSNTPIPLDTHLILLCEILDAVALAEDAIPNQAIDPQEDAA